MAKKITAAELVFKIGDDGTLRAVGQKAEKAAKSMNKLGGASQATDRRIKGVTQQSSNASKNFSKQAQTMQGGIVAVYATIAAQVFAVSAAFQFLQEAMNTRNMIEGQKAFGAATGVAYRTLSNDISKAAGGMIQFKQAAESAAIGTAAGLSSGQLIRLGTAAKNTSLALGRDLTDSFNRLVRGATKAEPELLDELGIVLRLEPAMKKYAATVGKSVKDLNQFEKTQAVTNEVLDQAESKFGMIEATMDEGAFALNQFLKAWDDFMKGIKETVGNAMKFILPFFSKNIGALIGAMTLFLIPILKSILPDFAKMATSADVNYGIAEQAANDAADAFTRAKHASQMAGGGAGAVAGAAADSSVYAKEQGIKLSGDKGTLSKRQLAARRRELAKPTSKWRADPAAHKKYEAWLNEQETILLASEGKKKAIHTRTGKWLVKAWKWRGKKYAQFQKGMVTVTKWASKAMNFAMKAMGWIAIATMIYEAGKAIYFFIKGVDKLAEKQKEWSEDTISRYDIMKTEFEEMLAVQGKGVLDMRGQIEQIGSAFGSLSLEKFAKDWNKALEIKDPDVKEKTLTSMSSNFEAFVALLPEGRRKMAQTWGESTNIADGFENLSEVVFDAKKPFEEYGRQIQNAGTTSKQLAMTNNNLIKSIRNISSAAKDIPMHDILQKFRESYEATGIVLQEGAPALKIAKKAMDDAVEEQTRLQGLTPGVQAGAQRMAVPSGKYNKTGSHAAEWAAIKADEDKAKAMPGSTHSYSRDFSQEKVDALAMIKIREKAINDQIKAASQHNSQLRLGRATLANHNNLLFDANALVEQTTQNWKDSDKTKTDETTKMNEEIALHTELKRISDEILGVAQDREAIKLSDAGLKEMQDLDSLNKLQDNIFDTTTATTREKKAMWDAAEEAHKLAIKDGKLSDEDEAASEEAKRAAEAAYDLAVKQGLVAAISTEYKKLQNKWAQENLRLEQRHALAAKQRTLTEKWRSRNEKEAITSEEKREAILRKTVPLEAQKNEISDKIKQKNKELLDMEKVKGIYSEDYLAKQQEVLLLTEDRKLKEQEILDILRDQSAEYGLIKFTQQTERMQETFDRGGGQGGPFRNFLGKLTGRNKATSNAFKAHQVKGWDELTQMAGSDFDSEEATEQEKYKNEHNLNTLAEARVHYQEEITANTKKQIKLQTELGQQQKLFNDVQARLSGAFDEFFDALFDGTQSFGDAMKKLIQSLMADLAKMYIKQAMISAMGNMGWGGARYGGVMSPSGKSFGYGGLASGPQSGYGAVLHGTEAVIPLGNDRSIPVKLQGSGGQNTVNVSINMETGQSSAEGQGNDQAQMKEMGRQIGGLVQAHLADQMRPGGILNPAGQRRS